MSEIQDTTRSMLYEYRANEREIETQTERLERLVVRLEGVGAVNITDMPRSPSPPRDRISDMISRKIEIDNDIGRLIKRQGEIRRRIEGFLDVIPNADERAVIRMRYFDGLAWEDVAFDMYGGRKDYSEKADSYLRRAYRVHECAMWDLAHAAAE